LEFTIIDTITPPTNAVIVPGRWPFAHCTEPPGL
jgi:hypothetical protein